MAFHEALRARPEGLDIYIQPRMLNVAPEAGAHRAAEHITDILTEPRGRDRGSTHADSAADMAALVATRGQGALALVVLYLLWSMARPKTKLARV